MWPRYLRLRGCLQPQENPGEGFLRMWRFATIMCLLGFSYSWRDASKPRHTFLAHPRPFMSIRSFHSLLPSFFSCRFSRITYSRSSAAMWSPPLRDAAAGSILGSSQRTYSLVTPGTATAWRWPNGSVVSRDANSRLDVSSRLVVYCRQIVLVLQVFLLQ